ncbi:MAG: hypothetical protein GY839_17365 [candidate division Zixibacteria bacterium]|nr:hypothetical protein [candidate division Zixibacteria bacterium]
MNRAILYLAIAILYNLATVTFADVIVKQKSLASMMGSPVTTYLIEYIENDKSCEYGKMIWDGPLGGLMGGEDGIDIFKIFRFDKNVVWEFEAPMKEYTETGLSELYKIMGLDRRYEQSGHGNTSGESDEYDWHFEMTCSEDEVDINGFKCKNITGKASGISKENPDNKTRMIYECWYADEIPGKDELNSYHKIMAEATGTRLIHNQKNSGDFYGMFGDKFDEMFKMLEETGGYPIKTMMMMENSQDRLGMGGSDDDPDNQNIPAAMKEMLDKLLENDQKSADELKTMYSLTFEILSIEETPIDDNWFEIPEGFTKGTKETYTRPDYNPPGE